MHFGHKKVSEKGYTGSRLNLEKLGREWELYGLAHQSL